MHTISLLATINTNFAVWAATVMLSFSLFVSSEEAIALASCARTYRARSSSCHILIVIGKSSIVSTFRRSRSFTILNRIPFGLSCMLYQTRRNIGLNLQLHESKSLWSKAQRSRVSLSLCGWNLASKSVCDWERWIGSMYNCRIRDWEQASSLSVKDGTLSFIILHNISYSRTTHRIQDNYRDYSIDFSEPYFIR